jgi:glutaredoxin
MSGARIAVLLVAVFAASIAAAQQLYRWTDDKGRVHVTDTPPPAGAKDVRKQGTTGATADAQSATNEPYALQVARKNFPVTLYTTPGCEACTEARKLLNARGVPFREFSVNNEKQLEELKNAVGSNSVPAVVVGSTVQKGFEEAIYHRILDAAGYPKTGVLPPRSQDEPKALEPQAEVQPAPAAPAPGPYAPGARARAPQKK